MAGITKSPQLRLSPETANVQDELGLCAPAHAGFMSAPRHGMRSREVRSLNMTQEYPHDSVNRERRMRGLFGGQAGVQLAGRACVPYSGRLLAGRDSGHRANVGVWIASTL